MGEAAGVAAVHALADEVELRDVDIPALQAQLARQGAIVERPSDRRELPDPAGSIEAELAESIHHRVVANDRRAFD